MDILFKTAEIMQFDRKLEDDNPIVIYPCDEFSLVTWSAEDNIEKEMYPQQIAKAIRLTRSAEKKKYRYIPTHQGFYKIGMRLILMVSSQEYRLRYMLA